MTFESIIENIGNTFVLNIFLAIGILLFGIILGKLVEYTLSKIVKATDLENELRPSFLKLIIAFPSFRLRKAMGRLEGIEPS